MVVTRFLLTPSPLSFQFRRHQTPAAPEEADTELAEAEAEERPRLLRAGPSGGRAQELAGEASADDAPGL